MKPLIVIRHVPKIDFMRWHVVAFVVSVVLTVLTVVLYLTAGLNYGIDFRGGLLIEARVTTGPADLAGMRSTLDSLGLGEYSQQQFGGPSDVLIRMAEQPG
ncbi:MAG: protein translocase subunit SecF, partial [Alphaproteobacteria bacterium]